MKLRVDFLLNSTKIRHVITHFTSRKIVNELIKHVFETYVFLVGKFCDVRAPLRLFPRFSVMDLAQKIRTKRGVPEKYSSRPDPRI
jgi:hypothetical protein